MNTSSPLPLVSKRAHGLKGRIAVPGDKSVSHRALMLGAVAVGTTRITGLLEGEDVRGTARALGHLGVGVTRYDDGRWVVRGVGLLGLAEPNTVLDLGNAGTGARLLMGLVATHPFTSFFSGDASLRRRPMARVIAPLERFGTRFVARHGQRLPLAEIGTADPLPIAYRLPMASAQVKSAVLLAGLNAPGETRIVEPEPTRDHTERLMRHFGATVSVADDRDGRHIAITGQPELVAADLAVPGDSSSAAFPVVAALLVDGADVNIAGVCTNPLRTGLYETLVEMGADLRFDNPRIEAGEPVADLVVKASGLTGVIVPAERAPRMIDEYPILAIAAACAIGKTVMRGVGELRVKESDRLAAIAEGLARCGAAVEIDGDDLVVTGTGRPPAGGATIMARFDHRIAMAFLVLGMVSGAPIMIDDGAAIDTSFPGFVDLMNGIGAAIEAPQQ
ncbi:MAG: 3-phosphoshikimate 1-carboxyvinyltransferase [Stellaceae bacterium]